MAYICKKMCSACNILGQIICSQHKEVFGALLRLSAKVVLLLAAQAIQNSPSKQRKTPASSELKSHWRAIK